MQKKQTIIFEGKQKRLDVFATEFCENYSRSLIQNLIKDGLVTVNGKARKPSWPLEDGDIIEITWPEISSKLNLKDIIVAETKDFIVINKPAGVLVHPQSSAWEENPEVLDGTEETLVTAILKSEIKNFENPPRAGLVHRLDRETSGIMMIAKNEEFQLAASQMFADRQMHKTYNAICCGDIPDDEGIIDVPIGRLAGGKIKASPLGRQAVTGYKVIERAKGFCFMELYPKTGRTNQLRVHMSWLGYPVLGDWLYKGAQAPRLMLHARKLEFKHPFTGRKLCFEAEPPADFMQAWREVKSGKKA